MNLFGKQFGTSKKEKKHVTLSELEEGTMPDAPLTISDADFKNVVARFPLVVIDCWAAWCMPCRMLGPIVEDLAGELKGKVVFGKLDVDENRDSALAYGIRSIPTLLIFKNGQLIDQMVGVSPKEELKRRLEGFLDE